MGFVACDDQSGGCSQSYTVTLSLDPLYLHIPAQPKVLELLYRLQKCTFFKNT